VNLVDRVLAERYDELGLAAVGLPRRMDTVLLTPRFVTSRHLVALVSRPGDSRPLVVAKIPRRPGDNQGVHHEAATLRRLTELARAPLPGVPLLLGTVDVGGHTLLVETAVQGTPLDPPAVRLDRERAVRAGAAFVGELPVVRPAEDNRDWYGPALVEPLDALAELVPMGGETARLCARTHAVLQPLRDAALPAVFEHGDLSDPNLFLGPDGELQVIDWERATASGVPAHDLLFFLQFVAEATRGATERPAQLAAFDDAFVGPGAWTRPVLLEHLRARGIDPELLPLLVLATWARASATLVPRLVPDSELGAAAPSAEALAAALSHDRDVALWRHALTRVEEGASRVPA
jgi:hypothetical protein